jgi:hypothetical protein
MKTIRILLAGLFLTVMFSSCQKINGKGDTITESRTITGYSGIELSDVSTVYFTQGDTFSLVIHAQENLMPYIETKVKDGNLLIREKSGVNFGKHDPIQIYITAPSVTYLAVSGSGNINVTGTWTGSDLSTSIDGSGDIQVENLAADNFTTKISGSGNVAVNGGVVNYENLTIDGSGNIDLKQLEADTVYAKISGAGDIYIRVIRFLDATIDGSGNIYYYGTPVITTHISGSGNITSGK